MVTYLIKQKINRRISQIIQQDEQRNLWTPEKLAEKTGLTPNQVEAIKESPATVPGHDLYRFFERGLDSTSWNEFTSATMELQLGTSALRNQFSWLIKAERRIVAFIKKSAHSF